MPYEDEEDERKELRDRVQKLEEQVAYLMGKEIDHNDELIVIGEELFLPTRNSYPSLYDVKQKLMKDGVVKKKEDCFCRQ